MIFAVKLIKILINLKKSKKFFQILNRLEKNSIRWEQHFDFKKKGETPSQGRFEPMGTVL